MYDDEEEIRRKRRNLFIAIGVVVGLIILLIVLLIIGSNNKQKPKVTNPVCELKVLNDVPQNANGAYTGPITIGFDDENTSVSKGLTIADKKVGLQDSPRNTDTYNLSKSGTTTVNGYIRDSKGNVGTCSKEFTIESARPNCELQVKSGTPGVNGWYTSDVVVEFKSKTVEGGTIDKYSIEEVTRDLDTDEILNRAPDSNNDTYTVTRNAETEVIGTVVDNHGVEATCMLKVKKDAEAPTCALEVQSGTKDANGRFTTDVVVGMQKAEDTVSSIEGKGVGITENYTDETYTVTADGKTVVKGFVKDKAGNKGSCDITIEKGKAPVTPPKPEDNKSTPSCQLNVAGTKEGDNYVGNVTITFKSKTTTNGATITAYGLGTSSQLNNAESLSFSDKGSHTIYGMVKDSNGHTAECRVSFTIVAKQSEQQSNPSCTLFVDGTAAGSGKYSGSSVTVKFKNHTSTNGAKIVSYGIGTKVQLSGNSTFTITSPGTYTIYGNVKDSYNHTATCKVSFEFLGGGGTTPPSTYTLATKTLKVGDVVNYTKNSKSIACGNSSDKPGASGWVVFKVTNSGVELITRGVPECYAKTSSEKAATSVNNINAKGNNYLDSNYASSVRFMNYNDAMSYGPITDATANSKRNVGVVYWLATPATKDVNLYAVRNSASSSLAGKIFEGNYLNSGIRPIVTLKSTVYVKKNSSGSYDLSTTAKDFENEEFENSMYDKLVEIINSTLLADFEI